MKNRFIFGIVSIIFLLAPSLFAEDGVTLFSEPNYEGHFKQLKPGAYTWVDLHQMGFRRKQISSIRIPEGYYVAAFEFDSFTEKVWVYKSDQADFVKNGVKEVMSIMVALAYNEQGSSRHVEKPVVYQDCNYDGYSVTLPPGDYTAAKLKRMGIKDNDISSITVPSRFEVILYEDDHYKGKRINLFRNKKCLDRNNFNDKASSIMVRHQPNTMF